MNQDVGVFDLGNADAAPKTAAAPVLDTMLIHADAAMDAALAE